MADQLTEIPYSLALLQFRPTPVSDESINVGVVVVSQELSSADYKFSEHFGRLSKAFPGLDGPAYRSIIRNLSARARTAVGTSGQTAYVAKDVQAVLRAILPTQTGAFRWSTLRYGVCTDLRLRAQEAFYDYVGRYEAPASRERVDRDALWREVTHVESVANVLRRVDHDVPVTNDTYDYTFAAGWLNGRQQVSEAISLDYAAPRDMVEQAALWRGRLELLGGGSRFMFTPIVTEPPAGTGLARQKYDDACAMLIAAPGVRTLFRPSEAGAFARHIASDLDSHGTP
jgi:hypothetical protein